MPSATVAEVAPLDEDTKLEVLSAAADAAKESGTDEDALRGRMVEAVRGTAVAQAVEEVAVEADVERPMLILASAT